MRYGIHYLPDQLADDLHASIFLHGRQLNKGRQWQQLTKHSISLLMRQILSLIRTLQSFRRTVFPTFFNI